MAIGAKCCSKNVFFCTGMTFSQLPLVTNQLDYASAIFIDPAVLIDETEFNSFTAVVVCHAQNL